MPHNTDVLIIGAGPSGIGFAIQLIRQFGLRSFEIVEKTEAIGGTWFANTYPGCGCDVASHFYSFSFALNPGWSQKFSLRPEIQAYFRTIAEKYNLIPHIRFRSAVQTARWDDAEQLWIVHVWDSTREVVVIHRCKILISAVGSLSIPRECEIPGATTFKGPLFHSAQWDQSFKWPNKDLLVIGNGCSATQFVPILASEARSVTQFARQAHYLADRPNPTYGPAFKAVMKYVPGAMRLYRFWLYAQMEKDFSGFDIESGANIRQSLKSENEIYVKRMAPQKYWDALIPKHEIGCKRKVMDTDYLSCLHKNNVELVYDDPIASISETGVVTRGGRLVTADAIVLATGFQVSRLLHPMEIIGDNGMSLNDYWKGNHHGASQAYFGTCVPGFKNFFILMGPNTVTGHLSVLYTVECQINFVLRLIEPIVNSLPTRQGLFSSAGASSVQVKYSAAKQDTDWTQTELKKLVWASGCTSWALDPETGLNIAMYPQYQFMFWIRSVFIQSRDFEYSCTTRGKKTTRQLTIGGWKSAQHLMIQCAVAGLLILGLRQSSGLGEIRSAVMGTSRRLLASGRTLLLNGYMRVLHPN